MMRFAMYVLACAGVGGAAVPAAADELYRQDPTSTVGGYSSQDARNPGGLGWFSEVSDNFTAPVAWTISQVEFWGGYVTIVPGNTHGFTIRFYTDNGGAPGTLLSMQDVATFTEEVYYTWPPPQLWNGYHYVVNLPTPQVLPGAGMYWISVVAILDRGGTADEPQWGWAPALAINPPPATQTFFGMQLAPGVDMGFVLNGSTGGSTSGACCRLDGTCTTAFGLDGCPGQYRGPGTTCPPTPACPQPAGACCHGSLCAPASQAQCTGPNTKFRGPGTICNAPGNRQSPCCEANFNQDAVLNVNDIFAYIGAWFANDPNADFGALGNGQVNNIFLFIGAWFAGCPSP